jgi:ferredoxin
MGKAVFDELRKPHPQNHFTIGIRDDVTHTSLHYDPAFVAISGVLPREEATAAIKKTIRETYCKRVEAVVEKKFAAVDHSLSRLHRVKVPETVSAAFEMLPSVPTRAPAFVRDVVGTIIAGNGDALPVSALPIDGTFPTATAQWEKRNIAQQIPVWDTEMCIQCGKCVLVCPHAAIRAKVYDSSLLSNAPPTFKTAKPRWREFELFRYTLQVAPEDCTGCRLCVEVCPAKSKSEVKHKAINMEMQAPLRHQESANWEFFLSLPEFDRERISHTQVKDTQLLEPLCPDGYLDLIEGAQAAVDIPVIASLNGVSPGGWAEYARLMEEAGADAIELNIYSISTEPTVGAVEVEKGYPVAVKLYIAMRLDDAGANGLVLFNRFYQPDFDASRSKLCRTSR